MRKHRVLVTTFATLFALGVIGVAQAWAQNGVISFWDVCNDRAYVMRGEAESASNPRVMLNLPASPITNFFPMDVSTTGSPVTVLLHGLFAVQVNDNGGNLVSGTPTDIRLAADPKLPPNVNFGFAKFSPTGDRVVIAAPADTQDFQGNPILVIADTDTSGDGSIIGLKNATVLTDLRTIGSPSDSNISGGSDWTGFPDFSPDGTKIVVTIFSDLWLLHLKSDGHNLDFAEPLTRTLHDTEFVAAFSPDGNRIAYTRGKNSRFGSISSRSMNIFTLDLGTLAVTQLTNTTRMGGPAH
jgi:hypothetical protein